MINPQLKKNGQEPTDLPCNVKIYYFYDSTDDRYLLLLGDHNHMLPPDQKTKTIDSREDPDYC